MIEYYVDPDATGLNNGLTKADAWTDTHTALGAGTPVLPGDRILLKGIQVLTSTIQRLIGPMTPLDTSYIKIIGVNSSWVNDGTFFTIDVNFSSYFGIDLYTTNSYLYF
jgi:hypothetical protein